MVRTVKKQTRQEKLRAMLNDNPFITDGALADILEVSIQTVRLDRQTMGIPELRARV